MTCQQITKKLTHLANLPELYKRCPPNQLTKFLQMRDKHAEYVNRVDKFPEHLPKIDWEYYRTNVRKEFVSMVDEFELKYAELNKVFDSRNELVDTSSYYTEVEQLAKVVKIEVDNYISESNKRIEAYEQEIARIRALIPYEQMTAAEFCEMCPEQAEFYPCDGKPSFWPHTPEEQTPGPAGVQKTPEQLAEEEATARQQAEAAEEGGISAVEAVAAPKMPPTPAVAPVKDAGQAMEATSATPPDVAPKKVDPEPEKNVVGSTATPPVVAPKKEDPAENDCAKNAKDDATSKSDKDPEKK